MVKRPMIMNIATMAMVTGIAKRSVKNIIDRANDIKKDTRKKQRLEKNECKSCFYSSRVGGNAMTQQLCMCCGVDQMYGSTAADALCMECSKDNDLCKHCGGDIDMKEHRREWPVSKIK